MRWLCGLAWLALVACRSHDEPPPPPTPRPTATQPDPWADSRTPAAKRADRLCPAITHPYFFAVEKDHRTSYILGTRHITVALAKFPAIVRAKLHAAHLVVFEVSPDDDHTPHAQEVALADVLSPADLAHYRELVGDTIDPGDKMSPAAAILVMSALYEDFQTSLEKDIEREAAAARIPMRGLETAKFQDDLLAKLLDVRMLRTAVEQTKTRDELEKDSADDLADYCAGKDESPGIDGKMRDEMLAGGYTQQEIAALDDQMVFQRNDSWIPKLEQLFTQDGVFVAVGADHLIGARGVIAQLAARGYMTKRLP